MKNDINVRIMIDKCKITGKHPTDIILERCKESAGTYEIAMTGYTDKITTQDGKKYLIAPTDMSNKVFIASKKITADFLASGIELENVPRTNINFFGFDKKEFTHNDAILIDIKSAYPTILLRLGIIKQDTYDYLMDLKKSERLKAIGILASKKTIIQFNNEWEKPILTISEDGKFSDIYFLAAYEIGEILSECRKAVKEDFLFFWFDGIYIKKNYLAMAEIIKIIHAHELECSISILNPFKSKKNKEGNFIISWREVRNNKKPKIEIITKTLTLPNKPSNKYRK